MRIPVIRGIIDRRILANFRVDPDVLGRLLPEPFRPQIYRGYGIAGICLIRLKEVRPRLVPRCLGIRSENAAHRIAVEWDDAGELRTGVYIPRRDTSSWLNVLAGGRIFPGKHHRARFDVQEDESQLCVRMQSSDGSTRLQIEGEVSESLPSGSVFPTLDAASRFFETGSLGYSPDHSGKSFDGLELRTFNWSAVPMTVHKVESSFFSDRKRFPPGSITFDHALLMRGIEHEWHQRRQPAACDTGCPVTAPA